MNLLFEKHSCDFFRYLRLFYHNFSDIWNLGQYCRQKQLEYQTKGMHNRRLCIPGTLMKSKATDNGNDTSAKKQKLNDGLELDEQVICTNVAFFRAHYTDKTLPKTILHVYAIKNDKEQPSYQTQQQDRLFRSIMTFDQKQYTSTYWEKNKKFAEQSAALVGLLHLGLMDRETLIKNGSILE